DESFGLGADRDRTHGTTPSPSTATEATAEAATTASARRGQRGSGAAQNGEAKSFGMSCIRREAKNALHVLAIAAAHDCSGKIRDRIGAGLRHCGRRARRDYRSFHFHTGNYSAGASARHTAATMLHNHGTGCGSRRLQQT